ncbi:MAG: CotH kinase family protein [Saprospiraceae bacterium]
MRKILFTFTLLFFTTVFYAQDLYSLGSIKDVKLTFKQDNWADILDHYKEEGKDKRLKATVTIDGVKYESVGVRHKGNSSYFNVRKTGSSKLPFNIKANHVNKKQTFPGGYTSLKLSNVFRDPSFLREVMAYEIASKYMPAPRANYVRLYVNDELLGLYNSTESVDEKFLEENFGTDKGTLIKCDPNWHGKTKKGCMRGHNGSLNYLGQDSVCYYEFYEMKSDHGWNDLIKLAQTLETNTKDIEKVLNVDRALWMLAYNNVLVNLDSYTGRLCHNYYVYKDANGRFNTIPWDMNMNFGGFRFLDDKTVLTVEKMQKMSVLTNFKSTTRPLISKLLQNSLYRKMYIAHVRTILKENFSNGEYEKRAKAIQASIDFYVKDDTNKLYAYEDFKQNLSATTKAGKTQIVGITELMSARTQYLEAHPLLQKTPPNISEVKHRVGSDDTVITAKIKGTHKAFVYYRDKGFGTFTRIAIEDKGSNGDTEAGDGIYSVIIPKTSKTEYYVMALNKDAAMFSPERAAFEVLEIK